MRGIRVSDGVLIGLTAQDANFIAVLLLEMGVQAPFWRDFARMGARLKPCYLTQIPPIHAPSSLVPVWTGLYAIAEKRLLPSVLHAKMVRHLAKFFPKDDSATEVNRFSAAVFEAFTFGALAQCFDGCDYLPESSAGKRPDLIVTDPPTLVECKDIISSIGAQEKVHDLHRKICEACAQAREQLRAEDPSGAYSHFVVVGLPEGTDQAVLEADKAGQQALFRWLYGIPGGVDKSGTYIQHKFIPDPGSIMFINRPTWRDAPGPGLLWRPEIWIDPTLFSIRLTPAQQFFYSRLGRIMIKPPGMGKKGW